MRYRILLRKIVATRKWQVWVAAIDLRASDVVPVVKHAGKPTIDGKRLKMKGASAKLPFNTLPTYNFDTKEDALGIAMQLGYSLKLGPMMYAWLDEEEG